MKKFMSALISAALTISAAALPTSAAEVKAPVYQPTERQMEKLDRGLVAVKTGSGVFLSWRLLGTESLENQAFDIYRDGVKIYTSESDGATCYTDASGKAASKYKVVPAGADASAEKEVTPWTGCFERSQGGFDNKAGYLDIKFTAPEGGTVQNQWYSYKEGNNTKWAQKPIDYTYTANDMSVGDLDGDGEYELIVKWDPTNSQDNSMSSITSDVYIDAYEINEVGSDGKNKRLWRLNLGPNIRAGAHYTQYMVYDFDGDGKAEMMCKTAPGSKDGSGNYVNSVGVTETIKQDDNGKIYRNGNGHVLEGPEYLTVFDGETGKAMQTVNYDPPRDIKPQDNDDSKGWGDNYGNRSERYLAAVAYINGKTPSALFCRGYYTYAYVAAYNWDGKKLTEQWISKNEDGKSWVEDGQGQTLRNSNSKYSLYGQGAHSVSVADVDNDGKDELIFGAAVLDDDGTVLYSDGRGHGDAEHVSDFDNDGKQEIFMVHEAGKGNNKTIEYAVDLKRYNSETKVMDDVMKQAAKGDIGRGVIGNLDDMFSSEDTNSRSVFMTVADGSNVYDMSGEKVSAWSDPSRPFQNFIIYWDGDLGRELLDKNWLAKYSVSSGGSSRFFWSGGSSGSYIPDISYNNDTKATPGLVADILGDWREEMVFPLSDGTGARIYTSCIPTEYRLATLMHDSQYRCAIAWQNTGYNQPPHASYYIGSASLATDETGAKKKYLAPAVPFTKVAHETKETPEINNITITGVSDNKADVSYTVSDSYENLRLIGALYDGDKLVEVKEKDIAAPQINTELTDSVTFESNAADHTVKVFLWKADGDGMEPVCESDIFIKTE